MLLGQIDVYSHFFKVSKMHPSSFVVTHRCLQELIQYQYFKQRGHVQKQGKKVYAARNRDGNEIRFHISYLPRFEEQLFNARLNKDEFEYIYHPLPESGDIHVSMPPTLKLRDYQEDGVNYILNNDTTSKLIPFPTGYGKTFTSLAAAAKVGKRMIIIVLGRYKEKWQEDVLGAYGKDCNFFMVKKMSDLLWLIDLAREKQPLPDVILITTTLMMNYINDYVQSDGTMYDNMVAPEDLYEHLGIGFRLIDEAHQFFHAVFKMDLYTHCSKCVYLTATLDTHDNFMKQMYRMMWPLDQRGPVPDFKAYDETITLLYEHENPDKVKCIGQQGYSHVLYEQSIWKHVPSKIQYLDMIGNVVEDYFLPVYEPGKKMLIFCSLVDTCIYVADYLNDRFKDKHWKISKFTAEDPKEIIDTNDISVSTLGKSGTALDIDGLVVCLMTVALSEPKANKQAKGRLRDLSKKKGFEHIVPKFIYFVGSDIRKHVEYHHNKRLLFSPFTKSHYDVNTGYRIGQSMKQYLSFGQKEYWDGWKEKPMKHPHHHK